MPESVVKNAARILEKIEKQAALAREQDVRGTIKAKPTVKITQQALPIQVEDVTAARLKQKVEEADINNLTPVQALNLLAELKNMLDSQK